MSLGGIFPVEWYLRCNYAFTNAVASSINKRQDFISCSRKSARNNSRHLIKNGQQLCAYIDNKCVYLRLLRSWLYSKLHQVKAHVPTLSIPRMIAHTPPHSRSVRQFFNETFILSWTGWIVSHGPPRFVDPAPLHFFLRGVKDIVQ